MPATHVLSVTSSTERQHPLWPQGVTVSSECFGPRGGWSRGLILAQELEYLAPPRTTGSGALTLAFRHRHSAQGWPGLPVVASGKLDSARELQENLNTLQSADKLPARLADNCLVHSTGTAGCSQTYSNPQSPAPLASMPFPKIPNRRSPLSPEPPPPPPLGDPHQACQWGGREDFQSITASGTTGTTGSARQLQ